MLCPLLLGGFHRPQTLFSLLSECEGRLSRKACISYVQLMIYRDIQMCHLMLINIHYVYCLEDSMSFNEPIMTAIVSTIFKMWDRRRKEGNNKQEAWNPQL